MSHLWWVSAHDNPDPDDHEGIELAIDDPGRGILLIRSVNSTPAWTRDLTATHLGKFLHHVTQVALHGHGTAGAGPLPVSVPQELAARLLPALQHAVVEAAAGEDRASRIFVHPDDAPREPLCAHCNLGAEYDTLHVISARCLDGQHAPFGHPTAVTWDRAHLTHERDQQWQETRRRWHGSR